MRLVRNFDERDATFSEYAGGGKKHRPPKNQASPATEKGNPVDAAEGGKGSKGRSAKGSRTESVNGKNGKGKNKRLRITVHCYFSNKELASIEKVLQLAWL